MSNKNIKKTLKDYWAMIFPMRDSQEIAFEFIEDAIDRGFTDIVIEVPTGGGKSAIGVTSANFLGKGYYLVTQKMLQDQLMNDQIQGNFVENIDLFDIRSSSNYECIEVHDSCQVGKESGCMAKYNCPYHIARQKFINSKIGLTNYSFLGKEYTASNKFEIRELLVLDEAHNIESEMVSQFTLKINKSVIGYFANDKIEIPLNDWKNTKESVEWLKKYLKIVTKEKENLGKRIDEYDNGENGPKSSAPKKLIKRYAGLADHVDLVSSIMEGYIENEYNYIHIYSYSDYDQYPVYELKPLYIDEFSKSLFDSRGKIRIYMSAFLGDRKTFCETIGREEDQVAWLSMGSSFPAKNRPVIYIPSAKISAKLYDDNIEKMLEAIIQKCDEHENERGIIHSNSYKLGQDIYNALKQTKHYKRILYPKTAKDREEAFIKHKANPNSLLISPSMTEGYDFKDDLAKWQIIAKLPFLNLIDPWVSRRKNLSNDWYANKTVETIVQTTGRVCRHENDYGVTYILDSDFGYFYKINKKMFPEWFKEALNV